MDPWEELLNEYADAQRLGDVVLVVSGSRFGGVALLGSEENQLIAYHVMTMAGVPPEQKR